MIFERHNPRATNMTMMVVSTSIILTWVEENLQPKIVMSALLAVMTVGFIILDRTELRAHKISQKLAKVWIFAKILLFVLVGSKVNITVAWETGLNGVTLISAGLVARSIGTYLSLWGTDFNIREKLFCVISYVPKATVQAAIGAIPLEMGMPGGGIILAVSVLSILLTAPLGAIGITTAGKYCLSLDGATVDESLMDEKDGKVS